MERSLFDLDPEATRALAERLALSPASPDQAKDQPPVPPLRTGLRPEDALSRPVRRFKRRWLWRGAVMLLPAAVFVGWWIDSQAQVILYNMTGAALPPLRVMVGDQGRTVEALAPDANQRWILDRRGKADTVTVQALIPGEGVAWTWQGEYLDPSAGHRIILRIWDDGVVEASNITPPWRQLTEGN